MSLLITGATGYIGRHLLRHAARRALECVAATRCAPAGGERWLPFDFDQPGPLHVPAGVTAVIHLAVDTGPESSGGADRERAALRALIVATHAASAKLIFVSSQTASADAATGYGRRKWSYEREVLDAGGWVVRVGQVYGGAARGLHGVLLRTVAGNVVLPAFWPAPLVQPIHVDDLAEGLLRIALKNDLAPGILHLGAATPVSFAVFLRVMARHRLHLRRFFVPAPRQLIALLGSFDTNLARRQAWRRLQALFEMRPMPTQADLRTIGLALRPLTSGMHASGDDRRRRLLLEARALLRYVLAEPPAASLMRRYVRAVERLRNGQALRLPAVVLWRPASLALLERQASKRFPGKPEFLWRLDAASLLAEATPRGARRFLGYGRRSGMAASLWWMSIAIAREAGWRLAAFFICPVFSVRTGAPQKSVM